MKRKKKEFGLKRNNRKGLIKESPKESDLEGIQKEKEMLLPEKLPQV